MNDRRPKPKFLTCALLARMLPAAALAVVKPVAIARQGVRERDGEWRVRFRPRWSPAPDPLTGWSGGGDPLATIELRFPNRYAAERYCRLSGLAFTSLAPNTRQGRPRFYAAPPRSSLPRMLQSGGRVVASAALRQAQVKCGRACTPNDAHAAFPEMSEVYGWYRTKKGL